MTRWPALLGVVLGVALPACHFCQWREAEGERRLAFPPDAVCPAAEDVEPADFGSETLEVLSLEESVAAPGRVACCYDALVHTPALDGVVVDVDYISEENCDSVATCGCVAADALLSSPEDQRLEFVPVGATVVEVVDGPTYAYSSRCQYRVRVTRPEQVLARHRCTTLNFAEGPLAVAVCPQGAALLGMDSPLTEHSDETITEIEAGPFLDEEDSSLPSTVCTYRITYKTSKDACG